MYCVLLSMDGGSGMNDMTKLVVKNQNTKNYYIWRNKMEVCIRGRVLCRFVGGTEEK